MGGLQSPYCPIPGLEKVMKSGELKIERGIPIPNRGRKTNALRALKVGECVLLPDKSKGNRSLVTGVMGSGNYATKKESGGLRVWRIK